MIVDSLYGVKTIKPGSVMMYGVSPPIPRYYDEAGWFLRYGIKRHLLHWVVWHELCDYYTGEAISGRSTVKRFLRRRSALAHLVALSLTGTQVVWP